VLFPTKPTFWATVSRNEQGMTLIELLASLALLVILLGVLSQFLYNGVHLWGRHDRAYERRHQLRVISQTLSSDLAALVNSPFLAEPALSGDEYEMSFWTEAKDGLVQIKYRYDQQTQKVFKSTGFWGSKPPENELLTAVKSWSIEYYRPKTNNWEQLWKPTYKNELPSLIRVTMQSKTDDLGTMVFPIKAWHKESTIDGP
jgi:prepilin-type N-terminal cleavage/methylation domain-containing protein